MRAYAKKVDSRGAPYIETSLPGAVLLRHPLLNKLTSFTAEERKDLGLTGFLPSKVETLEEQLERAYAQFQNAPTPVDRYVFLRSVQDSSEVLFYALLQRHVEEMMPIIYTPTVGQAVEQYSRLFRAPRGLIITEDNVGQMDAMLEALPQTDVRLVVVTDAESILGIGDQGVGGLSISVGKLSLYTVAAGVDPGVTLPVVLDVGTNREELRKDPLYLGQRKARLEGKAYGEVVDAFVAGIKRRFPNVLLQWEDFSKQKAFDALARHQSSLPSFNDDVQGTGAVVLAGLLAAKRHTGRRLSDEIFLVHGAGAGGVGVAEQIARGMEQEGLTLEAARQRILLLDSKGLILADRRGLEPYKKDFAHPVSRIAGWKVSGGAPNLLETVREGKVTALLGLSGQGGAFNEEVIRAVSANTAQPWVFALSNPTANTEVLPEDALRWTSGKALVATGSPFPDVRLANGEIRPVGQGNNAFIFPGLGLAALLGKATQVSEGMLLAASNALAAFVPEERLHQGALYPRITDIREASVAVATAVLRQIHREGLGSEPLPADPEAFVRSHMWRAEYLPVRRG